MIANLHLSSTLHVGSSLDKTIVCTMVVKAYNILPKSTAQLVMSVT